MRRFDGVQGGVYYLVDSLPQFEVFIELALKQRLIAVDTEASSLSWVHGDVCGIVVGWGIENNYYLPIDHKTDEKQLDIEKIRDKLNQLLRNPELTTIWANSKFDRHGLRKLGIEVLGITHDIVTISHLIDENTKHGVKDLACHYIDPNADKWEKKIKAWRAWESVRRRSAFNGMIKERAEVIRESPEFIRSIAPDEPTRAAGMRAKEWAKKELAGHFLKNNNLADITYDYIPLEHMTPYACSDVHYTFLIFKKIIDAVAGHPYLKDLYLNEAQFTDVLFEAEHAGAKIDVPYLQSVGPKLQEELDQLAAKIYQAAGYEFNIASTDQLAKLFLANQIKLTKLSKKSLEEAEKGETEGLKYCLDAEVLEELATDHEIAAHVLKYREFEKLKSTYVDNLRTMIDSNHFVHCTYNQNVSTGRLSCKEPNLTNIPAANKTIRRAFIVPDNSHLCVFMDFSQVEIRLTADRSQDPILLSCYPFEGEGQDVHSLTMADIVLEQPMDVVMAMKKDKSGHIEAGKGIACECPACMYDFSRTIAKRVNFGIIYGAGPDAIRRQVSTPSRKVTKEKCQEYIGKYFDKYKNVRRWINSTERFMKEHGYVRNTFGRYRNLPTQGLNKYQLSRKCRQGVNFLIQGEAADLFKTAAVRIHHYLIDNQLRTRLVNFVHDEVQFYWHKDEIHHIGPVKRLMEDFNYSVPIVAEVSYSETDWSTKKEIKA